MFVLLLRRLIPFERPLRHRERRQLLVHLVEPFRMPNAINGAARASAADADVQIAGLRIDGARGRGEAVVAERFEEDVRLGSVGGALRFERGEMDFAEGPISKEEAALIFERKLVVPIAGNPGRRASAQRGDRGDDIAKVGRASPEGGVLRIEPAIMSAFDDVLESRRLIPRQADAALVVGVESEEFAVEIEIEAVGIAKAVSDDLAFPPLCVGRARGGRLKAQHAAGGRILDR